MTLYTQEIEKQRNEAVKITEGIKVPVLDSSDEEVEEFATKIIHRAASLNGVKIDRAVFLRTTLKKYCPDSDIEKALTTTPADAGILAADIDVMAHAVINFETKKCAALSFVSGIPGGVALVGTVPADLTQYFAHVMRVEQKLAYLYGWQSFLDDSDEVDDETIMALVLLMGVMLQVGGAASSITKFATKVAQTGVTKTIQRQALTKTTFYPLMKSVLRIVGVKVTKEAFAKTVSKIVPVVGGAVSGGITYASFKPGAEKLRSYLRALPISGIDQNIPEVFPENKTDEFLEFASEKASEATAFAVEKTKLSGSAAGKQAKVMGEAAGQAAASGVKKMGSSIVNGAKGAGNLLGSIKKERQNCVDVDELG